MQEKLSGFPNPTEMSLGRKLNFSLQTEALPAASKKTEKKQRPQQHYSRHIRKFCLLSHSETDTNLSIEMVVEAGPG